MVVQLGGEFLISHSCLRLFTPKDKACGHRGASSIVKGHHTSTTACINKNNNKIENELMMPWLPRKISMVADPKRFRVWKKRKKTPAFSVYLFGVLTISASGSHELTFRDYREILAKGSARSSQKKTCSSAKTQSKPFTNFASFARLTLPLTNYWYHVFFSDSSFRWRCFKNTWLQEMTQLI